MLSMFGEYYDYDYDDVKSWLAMYYSSDIMCTKIESK